MKNYMKKVNKIFLALLLSVQSILFTVPQSVRAEDLGETLVHDASEFSNSFKNNAVVKLANDITLESIISKSVSRSGTSSRENYTIDLNGHYLICGDRITSRNMINLSGNVSLTVMDSSVKAGESPKGGFKNSNSEKQCRAIGINQPSSGASMNVSELNISNARFEDFNIANAGGAIHVSGTALLNSSTKGRVIDKLSSVTISNSTFINNKVTSGYAEGGAIYLVGQDITLSGNTFTGNTSDKNGGAISINNSHLTMTNNVITNNTSFGNNNRNESLGGGVYFSISTDPMEEDSGYLGVPYKIKLSGNKINYNKTNPETTDSKGGGLYLALRGAADLEIDSGEFIGNQSADGGGIYDGVVIPEEYNKVLHLNNVLITQNKAIRGGGIWLCPQSKITTYATLGGAIYNNEARGEFINRGTLLKETGDDIRYEGTNGDDQQYSSLGRTKLTVSDRAFDGTLIHWYKDESDNRYYKSFLESLLAKKEYYTETDQAVSLHGKIDDDTNINQKAQLIIKDNVATKRGGGIFSNNVLEFGVKEDMDLTVNKKFVHQNKEYTEGDLLPNEVLVNLYQTDENGNEVVLDSNVSLNKDNNWSYTFKELPTLYEANGQRHQYTYDVREIDESSLTDKTTETLDDSNAKITLTNTLVTPTDYNIAVEKKVIGDQPQKEENFTFTLAGEEQDGMELPKELTTTIKGSGTAKFDKIKFTKAGTYYFTVTEQKEDKENYTYDESVWTVEINVLSKNDILKVENVKFRKNEKEEKKIVFKNTYQEPKEEMKEPPVDVFDVPNPNTGDSIYFNVISLIVASIIAYIIITNKKFKEILAEVRKN